LCLGGSRDATRLDRRVCSILLFNNVMQKVPSGTLDIGMGLFFKHLTGVRRVPLYRFFLMVMRSGDHHQSGRVTTTWSAVKGDNVFAAIHSTAAAGGQTPRKNCSGTSARSGGELSEYTDRHGRPESSFLRMDSPLAAAENL